MSYDFDVVTSGFDMLRAIHQVHLDEADTGTDRDERRQYEFRFR